MKKLNEQSFKFFYQIDNITNIKLNSHVFWKLLLRNFKFVLYITKSPWRKRHCSFLFIYLSFYVLFPEQIKTDQNLNYFFKKRDSGDCGRPKTASHIPCIYEYLFDFFGSLSFTIVFSWYLLSLSQKQLLLFRKI